MLPVWIVGIGLPLAVGGVAAWLTMGSMEAYGALMQPPLSPPGLVFPVVWSILYILMGIASVLVWKSDAPEEEKQHALRLYGVQLIFNFIWPLLFFRAGWYGTAFIWLLLLILLVLATMAAFRNIQPLAGNLLIPYVLWLLLAAYLNAGVWLLN